MCSEKVSTNLSKLLSVMETVKPGSLTTCTRRARPSAAMQRSTELLLSSAPTRRARAGRRTSSGPSVPRLEPRSWGGGERERERVLVGRVVCYHFFSSFQNFFSRPQASREICSPCVLSVKDLSGSTYWHLFDFHNVCFKFLITRNVWGYLVVYDH